MQPKKQNSDYKSGLMRIVMEMKKKLLKGSMIFNIIKCNLSFFCFVFAQTKLHRYLFKLMK